MSIFSVIGIAIIVFGIVSIIQFVILGSTSNDVFLASLRASATRGNDTKLIVINNTVIERVTQQTATEEEMSELVTFPLYTLPMLATRKPQNVDSAWTASWLHPGEIVLPGDYEAPVYRSDGMLSPLMNEAYSYVFKRLKQKALMNINPETIDRVVKARNAGQVPKAINLRVRPKSMQIMSTTPMVNSERNDQLLPPWFNFHQKQKK